MLSMLASATLPCKVNFMSDGRILGLFAPRAGQHFRDEQRRRRSQFDRGTRLAELEDSFAYDDFRTGFNDMPSSPFDQSRARSLSHGINYTIPETLHRFN